MKDTPPDIEAMYHEMLLAKSPAERVAMAARRSLTDWHGSSSFALTSILTRQGSD